MNPTDATHVVTFQRQVNTQNEFGENTTTWENVPGRVGIPAQVLTGPAPERITGGAKQEDVDLRVNLWWFDGLSTTWRVVWSGQQYDIISAVMDVTAQREWRLQCRLIGDGT